MNSVIGRRKRSSQQTNSRQKPAKKVLVVHKLHPGHADIENLVVKRVASEMS